MQKNNIIVFLKFLVVVLSASLVASLVPLIGVVYADGTIDQNGVPADAVHIQTANELAGIGGEGSVGNRYFVLDNDIDLVDEWVPIDQFMGTFDGQGYSVNNLYVLENSRRENAGLFGTVRSGGVIKNVGVNINSEGLTATFFAGGL
jgi:hypothetical protein